MSLSCGVWKKNMMPIFHGFFMSQWSVKVSTHDVMVHPPPAFFVVFFVAETEPLSKTRLSDV